MARMTLAIVASSLSVGSATEMRRPCFSFWARSDSRPANSALVKVFSTNHLSTSSPIAALRPARSVGSGVGERNTFDATGVRVRTMIAAFASPMIRCAIGPSGSGPPLAPNTTRS
jgi:hypothetical protein